MTTLVIEHDPPPGANKLLRMHWAQRNDLAETWGWQRTDTCGTMRTTDPY